MINVKLRCRFLTSQPPSHIFEVKLTTTVRFSMPLLFIATEVIALLLQQGEYLPLITNS